MKLESKKLRNKVIKRIRMLEIKMFGRNLGWREYWLEGRDDKGRAGGGWGEKGGQWWWISYHTGFPPTPKKWVWTNEGHTMKEKYIQNNTLTSKLCLKYYHKNHVTWNRVTCCVVSAHAAGCPLYSGTVVRNLSWTPFGQNPRCSCPDRKHKSLNEKCWKQFPCRCVISQCYCQHEKCSEVNKS